MGMIPIEDFVAQKTTYVARANERLIPVSEYAKHTGLTPDAVRAQLNRGVLEGVKLGKTWRVKVVDDTAPQAVEIERLRAENIRLKMQLDLIGDILNKEREYTK